MDSLLQNRFDVSNARLLPTRRDYPNEGLRGQSEPILVHLSLLGMSSLRIGVQNADTSMGDSRRLLDNNAHAVRKSFAAGFCYSTPLAFQQTNFSVNLDSQLCIPWSTQHFCRFSVSTVVIDTTHATGVNKGSKCSFETSTFSTVFSVH